MVRKIPMVKNPKNSVIINKKWRTNTWHLCFDCVGKHVLINMKELNDIINYHAIWWSDAEIILQVMDYFMEQKCHGRIKHLAKNYDGHIMPSRKELILHIKDRISRQTIRNKISLDFCDNSITIRKIHYYYFVLKKK